MSRRARQMRGIALLTVLAVLAIGGLAVLSSLRLGALEAMVGGHQADQQRALAAAQALLFDAERDILGLKSDGQPCTHASADAAEHAGCRRRSAGALPAAPYFPQSLEDFEEVRALLQAQPDRPCMDGICAPISLSALTGLEDQAAMREVAARPGQFTQAASPAGARPAWYWVEMFRYQPDAGATPLPSNILPDPARPFVYRITALALGARPGTRAVVQSLFVPYPMDELP